MISRSTALSSSRHTLQPLQVVYRHVRVETLSCFTRALPCKPASLEPPVPHPQDRSTVRAVHAFIALATVEQQILARYPAPCLKRKKVVRSVVHCHVLYLAIVSGYSTRVRAVATCLLQTPRISAHTPAHPYPHVHTPMPTPHASRHERARNIRYIYPMTCCRVGCNAWFCQVLPSVVFQHVWHAGSNGEQHFSCAELRLEDGQPAHSHKRVRPLRTTNY